METKESRIVELKALGAGDTTCRDCLGMGIPGMDVCRQCIKDTPSFTAAIKRFMAESKVSKEKAGRSSNASPAHAGIDWGEITRS